MMEEYRSLPRQYSEKSGQAAHGDDYLPARLSAAANWAEVLRARCGKNILKMFDIGCNKIKMILFVFTSKFVIISEVPHE